ncbi:MAG: thiamine pyrophosphate-binding protein, partial [Pseudomonadota bacterium]
MTAQTIASLAVDSLIANGIDTLYCVPGVQNDAFFDALYHRRDRLRPVHARHEQGAAYMALGAALATGQPQAVSVVPGPGFLNASAALATAHSLNAPVMALVGQIPSRTIGKATGQLHEIDGQFEILAKFTKHAEHVTDGGRAPAQLAEAWRALRSGRPQPVGLEIPVDCWLKATDYDPAVLAAPAPAAPVVNTDQLRAAVSAIRAARCPLIVVGSGAQAHAADVRTLAHRLGAGVV